MGRLAFGIIIILALINLLAVFGPELGFDALWYHLTLPRLLLEQHRWYIPGGLLYYSAMPRLGETLFLPLLALLGQTGPKLLQFSSGLATAYLLYRIARSYFPRPLSIITALLFYATWLVSWQSGSAYVDLLRTFMETLALYLVLRQRYRWGGLFLGLAIGTKWHALGSLLIYALIFSPAIVLPALLTALPWFILAYYFTGNPLYPLFEKFMLQTQLQQVTTDFYYPLTLFRRLISLPFTLIKPLDDQLNPVLVILFAVGIWTTIRRRQKEFYRLLAFSLFGLIYWQLTPPPSSRYLLPYLPALALISTASLQHLKFRPFGLILVFTSTIFILFGRTHANSRYLPYLLGRQDQNSFLVAKHPRLPGTFIDANSWLDQNLPPDATLLVSGFNNLFYLPRPFAHVTWANDVWDYDYLVTTYPNIVLGRLIYSNSLGTYVYQLH